MATQYTSLLGLALPVTGELSGTWGDTVNTSITSLLDSAVAGTTTLSTDGDVTLSTTTGVANQARQAILLCSGARTAQRTITAPAQSKIYTVINATTGGFAVRVVGAGPTTGVTVVAGESAVIAWNGSDFIKISNTGGGGSFTNVTISGTTTLSALTASTALALNASKEVVSVTNTGSGNNVLATSPTLVTPILGTPTSVTLTNATGLPVATGISGLGTGVATALAVNTGTAGAFVVNGGALGTPSSGTVTNLTGTASININGTVGATTANTGAFTTLSASGVTTVQAGTASAPAITTSGDTNTGIFFPAADTIAFTEGGTESMRLDSGGNLGLGMTPNAWNASIKALQVSPQAVIWGSASQSAFAHNAYIDTVDRYIANGFASLLLQQNGAYKWLTAPSGTANNPISFTEVMTLSASGNLGIANTNPTAKLDVTGTAAISGAVTLSGGTANGVAYLNGSKVLTTGSALTFDGSGFVVSANSPTLTVFELASGNNNRLIISQPGTITTYNSTFSTGTGAHAWQIGGSEGMRLTSTGLGIGTTSPDTRLDVRGNAVIGARSGYAELSLNSLSSSASARGASFRKNWDSPFDFNIYASNGAAGSSAATIFYRDSVNESMRLDSAGNLGLGVTPSAWRTANSDKAFQIGSRAALFADSNVTTDLGNNTFVSAANQFVYLTTSQATRYRQHLGTHEWFTAPSGTAGNAITFTQAMTLNASGNLGIGTSSPGQKLEVTNAGAVSLRLRDTTTNWWDLQSASYLAFVRGSTEMMQIDAFGNLGLGVTPSAWISTSRALQLGSIGFLENNSNVSQYIGRNGFRGNSGWTYSTSSFAQLYGMEADGGFKWYTAPSGTAGNAITFTQAMTLNASGNLGIGTSSPAASCRLEVAGTNSTTLVRNSTTTAANGFNAFSTGGNFYFGIDSSAGNFYGAGAYGRAIYSDGAYPIAFYTNAAERMRLDASGNLGLGVTPSAWSGTRAIEIPNGGFLGSAGGALGVIANGFFNGTSYIYKLNGTATNYIANSSGRHEWYTAPSGTAGNAISFTQAMTLDASGNLGIGTTSPSQRLTVSGSANFSRFGINANPIDTVSTAQSFVRFQSTGADFYIGTESSTAGGFFPSSTAYAAVLYNANATPMQFYTNGSERARIDSSGNWIQSAPTTPPTLATNGTMVFNLTSNTNLRVSVRGSDGVTRTANITLA